MTYSEQAQSLIQSAGKDDLEALRKLINTLDKHYYIDSQQLVTDYEYDLLFKKLKEIETQFPELISADSPSQRVAKVLTSDFETVAHSVPMLSLDNSYNANDLIDFDTSVKKLSGLAHVEYFVEPKFDGASIALLYENDQLVRAATRGNGVEGDNITSNAKMIRSIPLSVPFSKQGIQKIELRGEVVIESIVFAQLNKERESQGLALYNNPRNTASGSLRIKDSGEVKKRNLDTFIYQIGFGEDMEGKNILETKLISQSENIASLRHWGFKVPNTEAKVCQTIQEVIDFCNEWEAKRDAYHFEIDGMVIKVNSLHTQQEIGFTSHHPRWAIAYKFKPRQAISKLIQVDYQVGRTGVITPVAKIEPVRLAGVTVSSISLHNEDFIKEKDIQMGDYLVVERAGDVIPYIASVDYSKRINTNIIEFPKACPICSSELNRVEGESAWRCNNYYCQAQIEERLIHFVSKDAMDIKGMGREIVIDFLKHGIITDIPSIYKINFDEVAKKEGWKEKSIQNLREGIEASKGQALQRLLVGLGIKHVGTTMAKMLASQVSHIRDFYDYTKEQYIALEDIGEKVANSLSDFFQSPKNREMLAELESLGLNLFNVKSGNKEGPLSGKTFVFTGFRNIDMEKKIEDLGGLIGNSLSKKTNYLVMKEKGSGSSKEKKALEYGTGILNEAEMREMLDSAIG
ncbi:MAG: NAD-dependent DNA ligase LigA [Chitinophagales bacterium]|nr:NAD-dependent DNA ligase LigA [Chitinophagales bacterium]